MTTGMTTVPTAIRTDGALPAAFEGLQCCAALCYHDLVSAVQPRFVILLLLVALVSRGSFHVHLCFDGSEPMVSMHATDHVTHHAEISGSLPHEDVDVFIGASALPRVDDAGVQLPVLLAAVALIALLLIPRPGVPPVGGPLLPSPAPLRSRPPSRGPPSPASH